MWNAAGSHKNNCLYINFIHTNSTTITYYGVLMSYIVYDLETTIKESYKRTSNCFDPDNYVVASGYRCDDDVGVCLSYYPTKKDSVVYLPLFTKPDLLIGHNIKFDLLFIWNQPTLQSWLRNGGKIWDTQLVEYMLSGQTHTYPKLDRCSLKYGGTIKDGRIKKLWKLGIYDDASCRIELEKLRSFPEDTQIIQALNLSHTVQILELIGPTLVSEYLELSWEEYIKLAAKNYKDQLLEYLEHDVKNTELVYLAQLEQLNGNPKLKKLIELQMDGLLATTEMEYNGMHVDLNTANANKNCLISELDKIDKETIKYIKENILDIEQGHLNLNSNEHMSALFFGGKIKYISKVEAGVFKTGERKGQIKYVNKTDYYLCEQLTQPHHSWKTKKEGIYSVDEAALTALSKRGVKLAKLLLARRTLAKELNTYYESMINLVQPDRLIHHSLNHTSTATGRLSSTKPNMQNIPRETENDWDVKQVFTSRHEDGVIVEADFKGAEVFAAAFVSQDEQMILDLESGVDTHKIRASEIWDVAIEDVTPAQKQSAKEASFQLLYGSGYKKIAITKFNGDEDLAKSFRSLYYDRYSTLKQWQNQLVQEVEHGRLPGNTKTDKGYPAGISTITSCTGRRYTFTEYDAPDWLVKLRGIHTGFSPTEIKNYPIQGLATADIVPIMIGKLFRIMIKHRDKALMVNTIHDSVLLDSKKEHSKLVARTAKIVLQGVKEAVKELGLDWNVPVAVEVKSGKSWGNMSVIKEAN